MSPFAYKLYISFFKALNVFLATTYDSLMKHFTGFAIIFTVGYMLFVGYMIMMGKFSKGNMISAGISLVILPAITFLFVKGDYLIWVVNPIVNTTTALSCYFIGLAQGSWTTSGEGLQGLFYNLDNMCYKIFDLVVKMDPPGGFMSKTWLFFQAIVAAIILFASYVAAYVAFLVQILLGFFCMYVFLVVGGICIFFAAFKQTRHIFFAWLKGLINYSLLIIFSSLIMTICYSGLNQAIDKLLLLEGMAAFYSTPYLMTVGWSLLTFAVLRKAADFASTLSGGQAGSTSDIVGGVGAAAGKAAGLAAGGAGLAAAGLGWLGNKAQMSNTPNLANVGGDAGAAYDKMNGLT